MSPFLFDSSAMIALCGRKELDELLQGWTVDLSFYELGNTVWKQVHLYRTLKMEEASLALDALISVFRKMKRVTEVDALKVLEVAEKEGLTYYDAAYLQAAVEKGMTLVTDDARLKEVGGKYVKAVTSNGL